jgi:hypothetical protein
MSVVRSALERVDPRRQKGGIDQAAPSQKLTSGLPTGTLRWLETRLIRPAEGYFGRLALDKVADTVRQKASYFPAQNWSYKS